MINYMMSDSLAHKKNNNKKVQKKEEENIASIVKNCHEHIPWLSMCKFIFSKNVTKIE